MSFIEDVCIFMKNNGNIIFRNINLNSNEKEDFYMSSLDDEEYIEYKNVYVDNSWVRRKFYKKYYYYDNDSRTSRFLEWKQTRDNTWDWYLVEDINETKIINIINYLKIEDKNALIKKKDIVNDKIENIINEYSLINGEHIQLINNIKILLMNIV